MHFNFFGLHASQYETAGIIRSWIETRMLSKSSASKFSDAIWHRVKRLRSLYVFAIECLDHWPQYVDSWLARFCILVNTCHRKSLGSHFTPVKSLDRHTDFCTCQCMKCNRWQVFSFKFHENSGKKMEKFPRSSRLLNIYWKLLKKITDVN